MPVIHVVLHLNFRNCSFRKVKNKDLSNERNLLFFFIDVQQLYHAYSAVLGIPM